LNKPDRYTITAALPYANGPLHIGHIAGVYVPADIYARYLRLAGREVLFVCGSDEHGAAITLKAKKEGKTPQEIVDAYHELNRKSFEDFGISFDIYHRTSDPLHHKTAQDFFLQLEKNGSFVQKTTEQYYDTEAEQFLADRYITGTCPKCGSENAYGDQCESCGSSLNPRDLINPKSTLSGSEPVLKETSHWFLPMENHEGWLREWIEKGILDGKPHHNPGEWKKQVLGQCKSWIDGGLQSRAMTRDLDWGVKVPLAHAEGKVLYVWLDAPIGYISATKAWAEENGKDWKPYWQDAQTKLVHFLAKDNIVFHCIIFPILLREHGDFILPDNVPANEFLNLEGRKISTSRDWAVWLHEYLEDFPGKKDELRYVLNAIAPEFRDSEFTWEDYRNRVNNELVAVFGNFVNRTLVLTQKYYDGMVPKVGERTIDTSVVDTAIEQAPGKIAEAIEHYRFRDAQNEMMHLARVGNKFLTETEPWKLNKTAPAQAAEVIEKCLQIVANLAILSAPFLPDTSAKIRHMMNLTADGWDMAGRTEFIPSGHRTNEAELLFRKIEESEMEVQLQKLKKTSQVETQVMAQKSNIAFDDFLKIDIRTATILEAERVPKTDKLLKLTLDTGIDKRTVVSGIAEFFQPEELPGRKVSILVNLEPRKIRGVESQGMILMAEDAEGRLSFVSPESEWPNGSIVR
jgi:methionyl-tRNA synthetase